MTTRYGIFDAYPLTPPDEELKELYEDKDEVGNGLEEFRKEVADI